MTVVFSCPTGTPRPIGKTPLWTGESITHTHTHIGGTALVSVLSLSVVELPPIREAASQGQPSHKLNQTISLNPNLT